MDADILGVSICHKRTPYLKKSSNLVLVIGFCTCLNVSIGNVISFRESMICMNFNPEMSLLKQNRGNNVKNY